MKPLSKEERELARKMFSPGQYATGEVGIIARILESEQYWCEAVKNADMGEVEIDYGGDTVSVCPFCDGEGGHVFNYQVQHKPDCPWLLANE